VPEDPLRGDDVAPASSDLQPNTALPTSRHAVSERTLVTGDAVPLVPLLRNDTAASQRSLESLRLEVADLVAQIRTMRRGQVLFGLILAVAIVIAVAALAFALTARSGLQELQSRQLRSDIQHAQTEDMVQSSLCTTLSAMRRTYSTAERNAYSLGGGAYDTYFSQLAKATSDAGCVP
jgi:hypothetical protein